MCRSRQTFCGTDNWSEIFPFFVLNYSFSYELDGPAVSALGVRSRKLSNIGRSFDRWPKIYYLELLRASESRLNCWSRLYLQSLALTIRTGPPWWVMADEDSPSYLANLAPFWRSGLIARLLRKRLRVRFPHSANICVHEHVCLYWVWMFLCIIWMNLQKKSI
jgi:hypothetical protein